MEEGKGAPSVLLGSFPEQCTVALFCPSVLVDTGLDSRDQVVSSPFLGAPECRV